MSRIGKKPIEVVKGVEVSVNGQTVKVKGPKGAVERVIHHSMNAVVEGGAVKVVPKTAGKEDAKFHGLTRTLISNMVIGVTQGFTKNLTLVGVGYKAAQSGKNITLNVGYSHPVEVKAPEGIELKVDKVVNISVSGAEKEVVGQMAASIRGIRPPEPYHGKGIRYSEEVIKTKVGKAAGKK
ncbi:MAG: 50S ribosomal protein L6 [Pseudomonadota bacterium]